MRVVVIGSSGHIGSYAVPALVQAGYEVVSVTRGARKSYSWDMKERNSSLRPQWERSPASS